VRYGQEQVLWNVSLIVGEKDTHWPRATLGRGRVR